MSASLRFDAVQAPWKRRGHVERAGVRAAAKTKVGAKGARGWRQPLDDLACRIEHHDVDL